jgi:hypothetical protein
MLIAKNNNEKKKKIKRKLKENQTHALNKQMNEN